LDVALVPLHELTPLFVSDTAPVPLTVTSDPREVIPLGAENDGCPASASVATTHELPFVPVSVSPGMAGVVEAACVLADDAPIAKAPR